MFIFRKISKKLQYRYENTFKNPKNQANLIKNMKFFKKLGHIVLLGNIIFCIFFKKKQEVFKGKKIPFFVKICLKIQQIEQIFQKLENFSKSSDIWYTVVDIFILFSMKRCPEVLEMTCVTESSEGHRKVERASKS